MTKLRHLIAYLETVAPPSLQASYDNSGLIVGDLDVDISGVLITLDCTEKIVEEAIDEGCNIIVAHHPIVFSGLKSLTGKTYVERTVIKAIQNHIAIYAIHTNLDSVLSRGVNGYFAKLLELSSVKVLKPVSQAMMKLAIYVPEEDADKVANAVFNVGGGRLGDYEKASFKVSGVGTFKPLEDAKPYIGEIDKYQEVDEVKVEFVVPKVLAKSAISAAKIAHPYEEMAFDLYQLEQVSHPEFGIGAIGILDEPMDYSQFLQHVCDCMEIDSFKRTADTGKQIRKIAVCGGSGSFLLQNAILSGADAFITSDFKYHEFFDAENKIVICDIGHYESEIRTIDLLFELISDRFGTFAVRLTQRDTNPVNLFISTDISH